MSDTEREIEVVAGTIEGVTAKKAGTWTVAVRPDGSQYTKNLWTKDAELKEALESKLGEHGAFVCGASYWTRQDGGEVRSLWIQSVPDEEDVSYEPAEAPVRDSPATRATPDTGARTKPQKASGEMTPEKWDAKERRDYRSRAWAQTLAAFTHTINVTENPVEVFTRLQPFQRKVYEDVCGMFAYPDDFDDVPF